MVVVIGIGFVLAYGEGQPTVVGHSYEDIGIGNCADGQILKISGGKLNCANDGGTYVGGTSLTYTGGEVEGYSGGDSKCDTDFSGSRMCTASDFVNAIPPDDVYGWYSSFEGDREDWGDCAGWQNSLAIRKGPVWGDGLYSIPNSGSCDQDYKILCCSK